MSAINISDAVDPGYFSGEQVIHGAGEFMSRARAPEFILEKVIQRGQIYTLTAKWGHGKTALGLAMAMHIAAGIDFAGFRVKRSRVLYLAGENPFDVQMRSIALCREMDITSSMLDGWLYFSDKAFPINDKEIKDAFVREVKNVSDVDLVFVDTGPAHSEIDEENSNGKMHKVAVSMREMAGDLNNSALITFMHPTQGATRDTLRSRGGGAYAGQVDGELLAWQDPATKQVEFWHSTKFRGSGFDSVFFNLKRVELEGFDDNFGNKASSVVAQHGEKMGAELADDLGGKNKLVYEAFLECAKTKTLITLREWRRVSYQVLDGEKEAKIKAFNRGKTHLLNSRLVILDESKTFRLPNPELIPDG